MKKLIAICLAMLMCLSIFAACGTKDPAGTEAPGTTEAPTPQESESTPEESDSTPPASQYDVEAAAEFLDAMYKNENPVTAADYDLFGQVMVGLDKYTVAWTVDSDKVTAVEGSPYWTIMVDEMSKETVNYKITGVITAPDGTNATVSYDRTVPEFIVTSFEEYMAATQDQMVTVAGIVVGINAKSVGNTRNHLFLADVDGKGGYYCYQLDKDPLEAGVKLGMTVAVTAPASPYSGMQETKGGDFVIVDETIKDVPVLDITDKFAAGESLKNYVGLVVTIKGVTITDQVLGGTSEYLNFELNGQKAYVRTYVTDFPTTLKAADKAGIDAAHAANFGNSATATGILVLYSGNPYLIPTSTDCFSDYTVVTKSDAEKVEAEIENLTVVENIIEDTTVELVLVGKYYEDVAIAWTIDNEGYTIDENGKLVIALADEQVKLTLTATFTCGDVTETKTFEINVKALAKGVYAGEHVDNPVVGTAYKFYLTAKDGKDYYFNGIKSGNYLQTSTNIADGVDVFVEAVLDGETVTGYRFYFDNAGVKTYIDLTDAGKANLVTENPIAVFNYVAETNCWVAKIGETDYYLGTYNDFNTIGASKTSYINAENTGVSQFPAVFAILEVITGKDETPTETPDESDTTETPVETPEGAIVVVIANHADANGWQNGTAYPTIDLGSGVTATATGTPVGSYGLNTGKYYENGENWRIYQSESPVVTISVSGGATIVSVKITYDSQNSGVLTLNGTQVESGTVVDVNAATVSFSVGNTGDATNGQARITAIEVVCG